MVQDGKTVYKVEHLLSLTFDIEHARLFSKTGIHFLRRSLLLTDNWKFDVYEIYRDKTGKLFVSHYAQII